MLLPAKHISFSESLIGFGSFILEHLKEPMSIDQLWKTYEKHSEHYPAYQSFDNMILSLDMLYACGAINTNQYGEIVKVQADLEKCA